MAGQNIVIIGMMGRGKSSLVKEITQYEKGTRRALYFDVNNEYIKCSTNNRLMISRVTDLDHNKFVELSHTKTNTCIVFEDSTGFIEGKLSPNFRRLLVRKRFTGNICLLLFHSVSAVPPRILQLCDSAVLFYTNDEDYQVKQKYPSLYGTWKSVKANAVKNPHYYEIIKL